MVGDVLIDCSQPEEAFRHVKPVLDDGDIRFANCEGAYSCVEHSPPLSRFGLVADPENVKALSYAGVDVMSCANNLITQSGNGVMLETLEHLRDNRIATVGAGVNLEEATRPAYVAARGLKVATVAYTSVFNDNHEATKNYAGVAPMRAWDLRRAGRGWRPGQIESVGSHSHHDDVAMLKMRISEARKNADIVLASFHWGDTSRPGVVTAHEKQTARQAIDFGADVVIGHHQHSIRGCEWYNGRPIFYGLGHFTFHVNTRSENFAALRSEYGMREFDDDSTDYHYGIAPRRGWPLLPFPPEMRMTMIGLAEIGGDGNVDAVGALPCVINRDGQVEPLSVDHPEGQKVLSYMEWACASQQLDVAICISRERTLGGLPTVEFRTVA